MSAISSRERYFFKIIGKVVILPMTGIFSFTYFCSQFYKENDKIMSVLSSVGFIVVAQGIFLLGRNIYRSFIRKPKDVLKYGKWAVVTGSTSGIGEAYSYELASRGMNILQISRSEDKLKKMSEEIKKVAKSRTGKDVSVDYIVHDFGVSKEDYVAKFRSNLRKKLDDLSKNGGGVGLLVNCVGVSNDIPGLMHETDEDAVVQMLTINNNGTTYMMQDVLPVMTAQKSGAVITVSSGSCTHATPALSVYSATKAFGLQLTRSMYYEYKEYGVDCMVVHPYYFLSNLYKRKKPRLGAPHPSKVVEGSLMHLGYEAECYGYFMYRATMMFLLAPIDPLFAYVEQQKNNRKHLLMKKEAMANMKKSK